MVQFERDTVPGGTALQSATSADLTALSHPCSYDVEGPDDPQPVNPSNNPTEAAATKREDKRQRVDWTDLGADRLLRDIVPSRCGPTAVPVLNVLSWEGRRRRCRALPQNAGSA